MSQGSLRIAKRWNKPRAAYWQRHSTTQQASYAEALKSTLNGPVAGVFTDASMHTPLTSPRYSYL
jgi:hypothetical protein